MQVEELSVFRKVGGIRTIPNPAFSPPSQLVALSLLLNFPHTDPRIMNPRTTKDAGFNCY